MFASTCSSPVAHPTHRSSVHLLLKLEHLFVQIEEHMNPSLIGRAFAIVDTLGAKEQQESEDDSLTPLDYSAEAFNSGIRQNMTLGFIMRHFPDVALVLAASWRSRSTSMLQEYQNVANKGPVQLLRRVVEGDGLTLVEDFGDGQFGEYSVALPTSEPDCTRPSYLREIEQAKELGGFLRAELKRLLGYRLTFGVGRTPEEARRTAKGLLVFRGDGSMPSPPLRRHHGNSFSGQGHDARPTSHGFFFEDGDESGTFSQNYESSNRQEIRVDEEEIVLGASVNRAWSMRSSKCRTSPSDVENAQQASHSGQTQKVSTKRVAPFCSQDTKLRVTDDKMKAQQCVEAFKCRQSTAISRHRLRLHGHGTVVMSWILDTFTDASELASFLCSVEAPSIQFTS